MPLGQVTLPGEQARDGDIFIQHLPVQATPADANLLKLVGGGMEQARKPGERNAFMAWPSAKVAITEDQVEYTSPSQQIRVMSEGWLAEHGYCLHCDSDRLSPTRANTQTRDFICEVCDRGYELKSKLGVFSTKVLDGAYGAMLRTIDEGRTPTFLLLEYAKPWTVTGLRAVHPSLISRTSIEARNPLSPTARRAGWIGCNIVLPAIAIDGQIPLVKGGLIQPRGESRRAFARLEGLSKLPTEKRGWAGTILGMARRLHSSTFSLSEMYEFESELQRLYPENENIRPKIRQQLQVLRDQGLLEFLGGGRYIFVGG